MWMRNAFQGIAKFRVRFAHASENGICGIVEKFRRTVFQIARPSTLFSKTMKLYERRS